MANVRMCKYWTIVGVSRFSSSCAGRAWWHQSAEAETLGPWGFFLAVASCRDASWYTMAHQKEKKKPQIGYDEYGIVNVYDLFAIIPIYPYIKNPKSSIEERSGWWLDIISVSSEKRFRIATFWFDSWSRSILTLSWTEHLAPLADASDFLDYTVRVQNSQALFAAELTKLGSQWY